MDLEVKEKQDLTLFYLSAEQLGRLGELYGSFSTPDELVARIEKSMSLEVDGVQHVFTDEQKERLREQSTFYGQTYSEYLIEMLDNFANDYAGIA